MYAFHSSKTVVDYDSYCLYKVMAESLDVLLNKQTHCDTEKHGCSFALIVISDLIPYTPNLLI